MAAPSVDPEGLEKVLAFQRRSTELCAEAVQRIDEGWVSRSPSLPVVWDLNHIRLATEVTPDRAVELCQTHLAGLGYFHLLLEEEHLARSLGEALKPAGWELDMELNSALRRAPDRQTDTSVVIEPAEDEALALMRRWLAEDRTLNLTQDGLRQVVESERLLWRARHAHRLGVRDPSGALVGITVVFFDGEVSQVEDVYVVPEARGHGYARALVTRASELASQGHEFTFIVADDNDWPKQLYAKLGFEPVGKTGLLHLPKTGQ